MGTEMWDDRSVFGWELDNTSSTAVLKISGSTFFGGSIGISFFLLSLMKKDVKSVTYA